MNTRLLLFLFVSLILHILLFSSFWHLSTHVSEKKNSEFTTIHIVRDKISSTISPKKSIGSKQKTRNKSPHKARKPIFGIPPKTLLPSNSNSTISAPTGNTTQIEDKGMRIEKEELNEIPIGQDLSEQPHLIRSTVQLPQYTEEALDNNIEGIFAVEVYVDENGNVTQSELKKNVGFGMDEKLLEAARQVRFMPAKDRYGKSMGVWTEIKFKLQIP